MLSTCLERKGKNRKHNGKNRDHNRNVFFLSIVPFVL